jgi:hypothetical protein
MKYLAIPPPERSLPQDQVVTESSVLVALLVSKMMSSGMLVDLSDEYLGVYLNQRSVLYMLHPYESRRRGPEKPPLRPKSDFIAAYIYSCVCYVQVCRFWKSILLA